MTLTNDATLTALFHGPSGVGKSWLSDTAPKPLLALDLEGRARYTPNAHGLEKVYWNIKAGPPPRYDGTWTTCIAPVPDYETLNLAYQYLRGGRTYHDFVSCRLDSLMEAQKRCIDMKVPGTAALERDHYSILLRELEKLVRDYRDLTLIPENGIRTMLFITGAHDESHKPLLVGALREQLPFYLDVVGYMFKQADANGIFNRQLLVDEIPGFTAKDGTNRLKNHYGPIIPLPDTGEQYVSTWMALLNGPQGQEGATA